MILICTDNFSRKTRLFCSIFFFSTSMRLIFISLSL